jgi:MFS family permease
LRGGAGGGAAGHGEIVLRSRVFLGGQTFSMLGDGLAALAIPLLVLQITGSPVLAVLASAPRSAGYLAAGLPAGVLADRLDPWRVLVGADIFRMSVFLVLFGLTGRHRGTVLIVLVLACTAGAATVFFETSLAIAVRDVFTGPRLVTANSGLEAANQVGQVLGPGVAGLLAAAGLLRLALLIDALTFAVSLGSLAIFRLSYRDVARPVRAAASWSALRRELGEGLRYLAATPLLLTLLIFMLVLNLCLGADKLIIFMAKDTLRLPAWQVGLVISAGGAGGILGAASASWPRRLASRRWASRRWASRRNERRCGPEPVSVITICAAVSGAALILIAVAGSMPVMLAGNLLYSWAIITASVTMRVLRQVLVPRELLGRVTASWRLGGQLVTPLGAILAGTATGLLAGNSRPAFAVAGALTIVTVIAAWVAGLRPGQVPGGGPAGPVPAG